MEAWEFSIFRFRIRDCCSLNFFISSRTKKMCLGSGLSETSITIRVHLNPSPLWLFLEARYLLIDGHLLWNYLLCGWSWRYDLTLEGWVVRSIAFARLSSPSTLIFLVQGCFYPRLLIWHWSGKSLRASPLGWSFQWIIVSLSESWVGPCGSKCCWHLDFGVGGVVFWPKKFYRFYYRDVIPPSYLPPIWKTKCTMKHKVFPWLLLVDRLNTRDMLRRWH